MPTFILNINYTYYLVHVEDTPTSSFTYDILTIITDPSDPTYLLPPFTLPIPYNHYILSLPPRLIRIAIHIYSQVTTFQQ